jgi:hypothetical protein
MENMRDDRIKGDPPEQQSPVDDDLVEGYEGGSGGPGDEDQAPSDGGSDRDSGGMGGDRPTPSDY